MKWTQLIVLALQSFLAIFKSVKSPDKVEFDKDEAKKDIQELKDSKYGE